MLRTKASTYAILAVAEIAKRQRPAAAGIQAGEIARRLNLPAAYAAKVLTQLARAGVLHSDRGPRGGFRLARPPQEIRLLDIVEAVDGAIGADIAGGSELRGQGATSERVDQVFASMVDLVRSALKQRTLADVAEAEATVATASISA